VVRENRPILEEAGGPPETTITEAARRPLKTRKAGWAHAIASWLAGTSVTPNQISVASTVAALTAGASLFLSARAHTTALQASLSVAAAICIQLRLLCNLLDGMVAIEGGRKTKTGEVFNDFPDRIADLFIIVGAGYAIPDLPHGAELGWAAALLSVLTAYVRMLGGSMGLTQSFLGPMAKPHRMALLTVACLAQAVETLAGAPVRVMPAALAVIVVGCVVTVCRRVLRIVREAEAQ
jgi:phosphatidylglycerophosphate synthase